MGSGGARDLYGGQQKLVGESHGGESFPSASRDCSVEAAQLPPHHAKDLQSRDPRDTFGTKAKIAGGPREGAERREVQTVRQKNTLLPLSSL